MTIASLRRVLEAERAYAFNAQAFMAPSIEQIAWLARSVTLAHVVRLVDEMFAAKRVEFSVEVVR